MEGNFKNSKLTTMKHILFFLLLSTVSLAQTGGYQLLDASGFSASSNINIESSGLSGAGTSASPLFAKNFFNANLTASGNRTHACANKTITINNVGSWTMRSGVVANGSITFDSTAVAILGTSISLSKGVGVNPRVWLDGTNDIIYLTSSAGTYVLENLPTYANEAAAVTGGIPTNSIYKTATGELRIKL